MKKYNFEIAATLNSFNYSGVIVNSNLSITIDNIDNIAEFDPSANRFFITSFPSVPINSYKNYKKHSEKLKDYFHVIDSFNDYMDRNNIKLKNVKYNEKKVSKFIQEHDKKAKNKSYNESEKALYFYKIILKDINKIKKYINI